MARVPGTAVPFGMATGAAIGLALGGAYLAGGMAGDAASKAQAAQLSSAQTKAAADALARPYVATLPEQRGPTASVNIHAAMAVLRDPAQAGALSKTRELECLTEAVYYEARGE